MPGATLGWMTPGPSSTTSYTTHRHTHQACLTQRHPACKLGAPKPQSLSLSPEELSLQGWLTVTSARYAWFLQELSDVSMAGVTPFFWMEKLRHRPKKQLARSYRIPFNRELKFRQKQRQISSLPVKESGPS